MGIIFDLILPVIQPIAMAAAVEQMQCKRDTEIGQRSGKTGDGAGIVKQRLHQEKGRTVRTQVAGR